MARCLSFAGRNGKRRDHREDAAQPRARLSQRCSGARPSTQPRREFQRKTKQGKTRKNPWMCLVLFGGIGTFQWVAAEKSKKIRAGVNSPPRLCAERPRARALVSCSSRRRRGEPGFQFPSTVYERLAGSPSFCRLQLAGAQPKVSCYQWISAARRTAPRLLGRSGWIDVNRPCGENPAGAVPP